MQGFIHRADGHTAQAAFGMLHSIVEPTPGIAPATT